jgi:hypothetical protein
MKRIVFILLVASLLVVQNLSAQGISQISGTLVMPFPSPYLADWETSSQVAILTVINREYDLNARVQAKLIKDDITIATASSDIITIPGRTLGVIVPKTTVYTTPQIARWNEFQFTGSTGDAVAKTGRLPEGSYVLHIQITQNPPPVSGAGVSAGSDARFMISYSQPPQLIAPADNGDISLPYPTFQWTPVIAFGKPVVNYNIRIVEILSGQTRKQASDANTPIFEQEAASLTMAMYPPSAFPLEKGKSYAWRVQALDPSTHQPLGANSGCSEIGMFTFGKTAVAPPMHQAEAPPVLVKPHRKKYSKTQLPAPTIVSGKMLVTSPFSFVYPPPPLKNTPVKLVVRYRVSPNGTLNTLSPDIPSEAAPWVPDLDIDAVLDQTETDENGNFNFTFASADSMGFLRNKYVYGITKQFEGIPYRFARVVVDEMGYDSPLTEIVVQPHQNKDVGSLIATDRRTIVKGYLEYYLGNGLRGRMKSIPIRLVTMYMIKDQYSNTEQIAGMWDAPDKDKVLATTTTDDSGRFEFVYVKTDDMGLVAQNQMVKSSATENPNYYKGDVYRIARIMFDNQPYYLLPEKNIIVPKTTQTFDANRVRVGVRTYGMEVTINAGKNYTNYPAVIPEGAGIPGMIFTVMRSSRPMNVPPNEGRGFSPPESLQNMQVVTRDTTKDGGKINQVDALVKNIGPNDVYYIYAESDPNSEYAYKTTTDVFAWNNKTDHAMYNSEYISTWQHVTMDATPSIPYIEGYLRRHDNPAQPIANATLLLEEITSPYKDKIYRQSGNSGGFRFDYLVAREQLGGKTPDYRLTISAAGFRDTVILIDGMKYGQRHIFGRQPILLEPLASITGRVMAILTPYTVDGIDAKVTIGTGAETHTSVKKEVHPGATPGSSTVSYSRGWFTSLAATGSQQQITVIPDDLDHYFPKTLNVNITKPGQELAPIYVIRKLHRINITVNHWVKQSNGTQALLPLTGASVRVDSMESWTTPGLYWHWTDSYGSALVEFESAATNFSITVKGPDDQDFVVQHFPVSNSVSEKPKQVNVTLVAAARISGNVYVGKDNSIVPYAHVYLSESSSDDKIETWTDGTGKYTLRNVRVGAHTVAATKGKSQCAQCVGDQTAVTVTAAGLDGVNLHLRVYDGMDITRLLGMPIEVQTLDSTKAGVRIAGDFINLPSNQEFSTGSPLHFDSIIIVPSTQKNAGSVPLARPKFLPVRSTSHTLPANLYGSFGVTLADPARVSVYEAVPNSNIGILSGTVELKPDAFKFTADIQLPSFWLSLPQKTGGSALVIPAFTAAANPPGLPSGYNVTDKSGHSLHYTFHGFDAVADSAVSRIHGDTVRLATRIHAVVEHASPVDLAVGDVVLHKKSIDDVQSGKDTISIQLEKWKLQSSNWSISSADGFIMHNGLLKTGVVDVPFSGLSLLSINNGPLQLHMGTFDMSSMSLGGIVPLKLSAGTTAQLIYETAHWRLFMMSGSTSTPAAYFTCGSLPGLKQSDQVNISTFYLQSDGVNAYGIAPGTPLTVYDLANFTPSGLLAYENFLMITGAIDMHIPDPFQGTQPSALNYTKADGVTTFTLQPFTMKNTVKGIVVDLQAKQVLDATGFHAACTMTDEAGPQIFQFTAMLHRTKDTISFWIDPGQKWQTSGGASYFDGIAGAMRYEGSDWANLWLDGDLKGTEGASGRIHFVVKGEIVADGQKIGVTNVPTPFGSVALTYDYQEHRLLGSLDFSEGKKIGGALVKGMAEVCIDKIGWYFLAGGHLTLEGLGGEVAMIFGNYPMTDHIRDRFNEFSWVYAHKGTLPPTFPTTIKGMYGEGELQMPVLIPDIDLDFLLVSGRLYIHVGADERYNYSFDNGGTVGYGVDYFGEAGVGVGASCIIACAGIDASALVDFAGDGQISLDGSWMAECNALISVCGSAYYGEGICDSDCDGVCDKHTNGGCVGIGIKGHVGNDGISLKPYIQ